MKIKIDWSKTTLLTPKVTFLLFLILSVALAASIWLRIIFTIDAIFRFLSTVFNVAISLVLPIVALFYILAVVDKDKGAKLRKASLVYLTIAILFYAIFLIIDFWSYSLFPEYLFLWAPVPLALIIYAKSNRTSRLHSKKLKLLAVTAFIVALALPNLTVAYTTNLILTNTALIDSDLEKANYICRVVEGMTCFTPHFRANEDYWKFMLTGVGHCGEMAIAKKQFLLDAGFEARKVLISGENHAFVEVKIDGEWMVADGESVITREKMTQNRIGGIGSLTYVCTLTEDQFIELTQEYTNNTDTITVQVTKDGETVEGARVQLKHTFAMKSGNITQTLPAKERYFMTDNNGTVVLHLAKPNYIGEFEHSEPYYWVYVNDVSQSVKVTSKGLGAIQPITEIQID